MIKVELKNASKIYPRGKEKVYALDNCNLKVEKGDFISIMGPSGSGKSTLLKAIATSLILSDGDVYINNNAVGEMDDADKSLLRAKEVGYIVQNFMLLPNETVYENIRLPLVYNKSIPRSEHRQRVEKYAEKLGISPLLRSKAKDISGGESQRVAIARAICGDQEIVLADEPTGALDTDNREVIMDLFNMLNKELGKTIIVVTHDEFVAEQCEKHFTMHDGVLSEA